MAEKEIKDGQFSPQDIPDPCNLIVNYLPSTLTEQAFKNLFSSFGETENIKLMVDKYTGTSLGYGFVKYGNEAAAFRAINSMNGKSLGNKVLKVSYARPSSPSIQNANLYISKLGTHITKEDLEQYFSPYGKVIDAKILYGESKGVGFIRFDHREDAEQAIAALNETIPPGNAEPIFVKFADTINDKKRKRNQHQQFFLGKRQQLNQYENLAAYSYPTIPAPFAHEVMAQTTPLMEATLTPTLNSFCLFVYNIPPESDDSFLYRLFGPFGGIVSVKIPRDPSGKSKGFGFVNFLKYEDAQQAILALNGYNIGNKVLQVSFKKEKNLM